MWSCCGAMQLTRVCLECLQPVLTFSFILPQGVFDKPAHERGGDELPSVVQLLQGLQQFQGLCREAQIFVALHAHLLVLQEGVELSGYVVRLRPKTTCACQQLSPPQRTQHAVASSTLLCDST
jgi:hypothetical protein